MKRSTRTALGIAAHALTEDVLRGKAPDIARRRPWLEDRWESLIQEQIDRLQTDWPGRPIPHPNSWRGYVATRTRLLRRLEAEQVVRDVDSSAAGGKGLLPLPWVELTITDEQTGLFGTPDRVEMRDGQLRVVDLKSGVHQSLMNERQQRQLLLYAHLVHVKLGRYPNELVIQDSRGREQVTNVSERAVKDAVNEAVVAMASFNTMAASGRFPVSASEETCEFCEFQVVCSSYWEARSDDWSSIAALGLVAQIDSGVAILTTTTVGDSSVKRLILCDGVDVRQGDVIVAANLERAGTATGRMKWNSPLRQISE